MTVLVGVAVVAFVFGACAGSFLNVCIYRLPRRCMGIGSPSGSICPACRAPIRVWHNLPIVSWMLLRGRCASCRSPIRARYPGVELLTAVLFAVAAVARLAPAIPGTLAPEDALPVSISTLAALGFDFYLVMAVVVLSFVDLDLHIIPDEISLTAVPVGLVAGAVAPTALLLGHSPAWTGLPWADGLAAAGLGALAGGGGLWLLGWLGAVVFRRPAMGLGDVKILAAFGAFVGWDGCAIGLFLGAFAGAMMAGLRFRATRSHHLAFGPYLAFGALAVRLLDERVYSLARAGSDWVALPGNIVILWVGLGLLMTYMIGLLLVILRDGRRLAQAGYESGAGSGDVPGSEARDRGRKA